jgi:hypothetical protein
MHTYIIDTYILKLLHTYLNNYIHTVRLCRSMTTSGFFVEKVSMTKDPLTYECICRIRRKSSSFGESLAEAPIVLIDKFSDCETKI